jgi:hypothetical protein
MAEVRPSSEEMDGIYQGLDEALMVGREVFYSGGDSWRGPLV